MRSASGISDPSVLSFWYRVQYVSMVLLSMFCSVKLSSRSSFMLGLFWVSIPLSVSMRVMVEMAPGWCCFVLIISIRVSVSRRFI